VELVALLVLFALVSRSGSTTSQGGGEQPQGQGGGDPLGEIIAGTTSLLGLVGVGGGAGAGGTAGAGLVAGGGTVGGTGGPAAAALGSSAFMGPLIVALTVNPIAWVVYAVIGTQINKAQEQAKQWLRYIAELQSADAFALYTFEAMVWRAYLAHAKNWGPGAVIEERYVVDDRATTVGGDGGRINFQGFRSVLRFLPNTAAPDVQTEQRARFAAGVLFIRAMGLRYLEERHRYWLNWRRGWFGGSEDWPTAAEPGWRFDSHQLDAQFNFDNPGIHIERGGLRHLPLLSGGTVLPRVNEQEPLPSDEREQQADPPWWDTVKQIEIPLQALQVVRLMALIDALQPLRRDPTIYFPWNLHDYADQVVRKIIGTSIASVDPDTGKVLLTADYFGGAGASVNLLAFKDGLNSGHVTPRTP
jgi:hypothetical protein